MVNSDVTHEVGTVIYYTSQLSNNCNIGYIVDKEKTSAQIHFHTQENISKVNENSFLLDIFNSTALDLMHYKYYTLINYSTIIY